MSLCIEKNDEMVVLIPMERDGFEDEEVRSFRQTRDALLRYAAERLGIDPPARASGTGHEPEPSEEERRAARAYDAFVAEQVWRTPEAIEDFVAQNPAGLTGAQLEDAALWRYSARGLFFVVDVQKDHTLYLDKHRILCVRELIHGAEAPIQEVPSAVFATLLPYRGAIVVDGKPLCIQGHLDEEEREALIGPAKERARRGVISTSGELVGHVCAHPDAHEVEEGLLTFVDLKLGLAGPGERE